MKFKRLRKQIDAMNVHSPVGEYTRIEHMNRGEIRGTTFDARGDAIVSVVSRYGGSFVSSAILKPIRALDFENIYDGIGMGDRS